MRWRQKELFDRFNTRAPKELELQREALWNFPGVQISGTQLAKF